MSQPFEPLQVTLAGQKLVEASAGTGKTYNIANLYLRLVSGLGEAAGGNAVPVERILVVTFTRAAAAELRGRIRSLLERGYRDFRAGHSSHPFLAGLLASAAQSGCREEVVRRFHRALLGMDDAAISTIHSFAVKAAATFIFETGTIEGSEITLSGSEHRQARLLDVYRRLAASGEAQDRAFFNFACGMERAAFIEYFGQNLPGDTQVLAAGGKALTLDELHADWLALYTRHQTLVQAWGQLVPGTDFKQNAAHVQALFNQQLSDQAHAISRASNGLAGYLLRTMQGSEPVYEDKSDKQYWQQWMSIPAASGAGDYFDLVMAARDQLQSWFELQQAAPASILLEARAATARLALDQLALDDIITLVNQRLDDPQAGPALRAAINQAYPVCLVDEFQDTDPAQFQMFNRLYGEGDASAGSPAAPAFFMIGDPKQSIYAFRGADIFAYLNVREQVRARDEAHPQDPSIFTLNENFRSKQALVEATNALFAEHDGASPTFLFPGLEYERVKSAEQRGAGFDRGHLELPADSGLNTEPLVFIGNAEQPGSDDSDFSGEALRRRYAADTAARISALLDAHNGASIARDGHRRRLQPGDIAVLVRSGREAQAVRSALARPEIGLRSVYLSQKDSVLRESEISGDLYHLLVAMHEASDQRRLKSALATPLVRGFAGDFAELDRLEADPQYLERLINEFGEYRERWRRDGILPALNRLLHNPGRQLLVKMAAQPNSDRLLTDLRHIGDLLQQQDLDCDSPEQLIDWYSRQLDDESGLDEEQKRIRLESDEDLVKITTIHVAKGLEYPVVFLPFFYMPRAANLAKDLPLYRWEQGGHYQAVVDFASDDSDVAVHMSRESLAEDMRLLYVAITRAIYQCQVGISNATYRGQPLFGQTVWAHLLGQAADGIELPEAPGWPELKAALQQRLGAGAAKVGFSLAGSVPACRYQASSAQQLQVQAPAVARAPQSHWQISSYSALARGSSVSLQGKDDDDQAIAAPAAISPNQLAADQAWADDIRFRLRGGAQTGNALHDIFEQQALQPEQPLASIVSTVLPRYGLHNPPRQPGMGERDYQQAQAAYQPQLVQWLQQVLAQPLGTGLEGAAAGCPALQELFNSGQAIPEMNFDFRLGSRGQAADFEQVNAALEQAGIEPLQRYGPISGLMNGAIDLSFIHQHRIYVLDYKSNLLGKAPRHYDQHSMAEKMREARYDLQYLIYSVAAHRYMAQRLGSDYQFDGPADDGGYAFGGVFYLFLRGMGLPATAGPGSARHGIWFTRPGQAAVDGLDAALLATRGPGA
jgi:exodeoxyribonuclease V beta subunit